MDVFEKIRAQQGAELTPVWMVGEQLADIIRHDERAQEIVSRDLGQSGMSLADCEKMTKRQAERLLKAEILSRCTPLLALPHEMQNRIVREYMAYD